jgi:hypothetical protein
MRVEVSLGEVVDKLSILDIKVSKIGSPDKKIQIEKERAALQEARETIQTFPSNFWYTLLLYVNTKIWELTDIVKSLSPVDNPNEFAKIANDIFEYNQQRFRIKDRFNKLSLSLQEQKSYAEKILKLGIDSLDTFYSKLSAINKISLEYDKIEVFTPFESEVKRIYSTYPFSITRVHTIPSNCITLETLEIPDEEVFTFPPISYIVGGRLGDCILSLSIVNENFLKTGRKGLLLASNRGDIFQFGIQQFINDTLSVLREQPYFHDVQEYTGQNFTIDLTEWRDSPLLFKGSWQLIYSTLYKLPWGRVPWLRVKEDPQYSNTVFLHSSMKRYSQHFETVLKDYPNCVFLTQNIENYNAFVERYKCPSMPVKVVTSFYEMCQAIQSCKKFICNLTSQYAIANAMFKESCCLLSGMVDDIHNSGMVALWPHTKYYEYL